LAARPDWTKPETLFSVLSRWWGKAVEDYRSPRRFAITKAAGKSARFWTAPVLWRFGCARELDEAGSLVLSHIALVPLAGLAI